MQRYQYQNLESKWSMATVLGATALVAVSVGAAVGLAAGNAASTTLYAPATTTVQTAAVAVPVARRPVQTYAERVAAEPAAVESVEQMAYEAPQTTFNWAPVAALIALPTAIAAFLLRKAEESPLKVASAGLAASALLASVPMPANATEPLNGLVPCAENKKFDKNLKKEVKNIEKREKLYEPGSAPYLALEATKARTQARFDKYAKAGLLCGTDGLPHLISDPGLAVRYGHAGETFIPTFGFLYIAGYIGTAGRTYLQEISSRQKPTQSEIIIDVPLATSIAFRSWDWPGKAIQELATGKLLEKDENIPVSRR